MEPNLNTQMEQAHTAIEQPEGIPEFLDRREPKFVQTTEDINGECAVEAIAEDEDLPWEGDSEYTKN